MRHEAWETFRSEVLKLIAIHEPNSESLKKLDSLSITEVCILAEEKLLLELSFEDVKKANTLSDLKEIVERKSQE